MKLALAFVLAVFALLVRGEIKSEDGVLVVTDANYEAVIRQHPKILLMFYAAWCHYSVDLLPEYVKATKALNDSKSAIKLAKIDIDWQPEITKKYQVKGYPTVYLYDESKTVRYHGARKAESIVDWLFNETNKN